MEKILALDQGTTSSRAIIFDQTGKIRALSKKEYPQIFPQPGWVEHDPKEIWNSQRETAQIAMHHGGIHHHDIAAIGITNQRETTLVWNRRTGEPIYNAIVWQDRRTAYFCAKLEADGLGPVFQEKTGLCINPYFSATKIRWILDHVEGAQTQAERGDLAFGTVDSWILWNLSPNRLHKTDVTNAARTLLFNIYTQDWDDELLDILNIPRNILPEICSSSEIYCQTNTFTFCPKTPVASMAGDQSAALFGQGCLSRGEAKNTYGTGCFLLANTGDRPIKSKHKLLSTIGWKYHNKTTYALEGSVFIGGALIQWLRDEMGFIHKTEDIEALAGQVNDTEGVYLVPAFTGLGAPHWDSKARGTISGLSRGTGKAHIARAALEAICFQSLDLLQAMEADLTASLNALKVDGNAATNNLLMQIQADFLQIPVHRPTNIESTAFGAAALAGMAIGLWKTPSEIVELQQTERTFEPSISSDEAAHRHHLWLKAVEKSRLL